MTHRTVNNTASVYALTKSEMKKFYDSWITLNDATCSFAYWTEWGKMELIKRFYPQLLDDYLWVPNVVSRGDIIRFVFMLDYGGIYGDLDVSVLFPPHNWKEAHPDIRGYLGMEFCENYKNEGYDRPSVMNSFFAFSPGHVIPVSALKQIHTFIKQERAGNVMPYSHLDWIQKVLRRTGPALLSLVVDDYFHSLGSSLDQFCEENNIHYYKESGLVMLTQDYFSLRPHYKGLYIRHRAWCSWMNERNIIRND